MKAFEFYIPILRNSDRVPHSPTVWKELERSLLESFGGFTRKPEVTGAWLNDAGDVVPDHSRVYLVAVQPGKEQTLRSLLKTANSLFDQECIYCGEAGYAELIT